MTEGNNRSTAPSKLALLLGIGTVGVGAIVVLGWTLKVELLKSIFPALVTMKANTAAGLLLCGSSLAILAREKPGVKTRVAAVILALLATALGGLTLCEYVFGWQAGLDQLLLIDRGIQEGTSSPGRMSPSTAYCFVLSGIALVMAAWRFTERLRWAGLSALGTTLLAIGVLAFAGETSDVLLQSRLWIYVGMAIPTAMGFVMLGCGVLVLAHREAPLRWWLDGLTTGGFVVGIILLGSSAAVSYHYTSELEQGASRVARTQEILREMETLTADTSALGSSQRNFINTGEERFVKQEEDIKNAVNQDLTNLFDLAADSPEPLRGLDKVKPLVVERVAWGEETITARRTGGLAAAEQMIAAGKGVLLSESLRNLIKQMEDQEYSFLEARQNEEQESSETTFLVLPLGVFLSATLLLLGLFFLNAGWGQRIRAEKQVAWLASFPERNPNPIIELDAHEDVVHYVNPAALKLFPDLPKLGVQHPWLAGIRKMTGSWEAQGEKPVSRELGAGEKHWTQIVNFVPETKRLRVYGTDITERRAAEAALAESREEFKDLFDSAPIGYHELDGEGRMSRVNLTELKMLGYRAEDLLGQYVWSIATDPEAARSSVLQKLAGEPPPDKYERMLKRKDGSVFPVLVHDELLRREDGTVRGIRTVFQDITERKQAEDQIQKLNSDLERRVVERTAQLEAANKELEAFSYSVSHDLRAPLRAVHGFSQVVLEDYGPQLPEGCQRDLQTIRAGAQKMGELIDDLLTFSRLSRLPLSKSEINTENLVRSVLGELLSPQEVQQVQIRVGKLPVCEGDPALLKQVWINLLSNAVKYSRKSEAPTIEVGFTRENGENIYFVSDNGTGFDMKYAHKLFGVFQRLHRAEDYEGTGVGLAIVQRVINRHGGRVWAQSVPRRGATFYFTLEGKLST
jgi:PAS domain S-box-containing protein